MTNAEKKAFLAQYGMLNDRINRWEREKEKWEDLARKVSPTYSDMPKGGNGDRLLDCVEKIIDLESRINQEIDKLVDLRVTIEAHLDAIKDEFLKDILRDIYIDGLTLEEVAVKRGYCYRHIERKHQQALNVLECPMESA